jgi:hypothetical protein
MQQILSTDDPGFVSLVVLAEVVSVLWRAERRYEGIEGGF